MRPSSHHQLLLGENKLLKLKLSANPDPLADQGGKLIETPHVPPYVDKPHITNIFPDTINMCIAALNVDCFVSKDF